MTRQGRATASGVDPLIGLISYYTFIKWLLPLILWATLVGVSWWEQSQIESLLLVTGLAEVMPYYLLSLFVVGWGLWLLRHRQRFGALIIILLTGLSLATLVQAMPASPLPYGLLIIIDILVIANLILQLRHLEGMAIGAILSRATVLQQADRPIEQRILHWLAIIYVVGQFVLLLGLLYMGAFATAPYLTWLSDSVAGIFLGQINGVLLSGLVLLGAAAIVPSAWQALIGRDEERFCLMLTDLLLAVMVAKALALALSWVITPTLFYFAFCLDLIVLGYVTASLSQLAARRLAPWLGATFILVLTLSLFLL